MMDDTRWDGVTFAYDPNVCRAEDGQILVGLGNPLDADQPGVVLNTKYPNSPFRSVSNYVRAADPATLGRWRASLPNGMTNVRHIVLEDLSLDTCFSLLLFTEMLGRGAIESSSSHVGKWCDYVTRWEDGYTREQRPWIESIAYLVTALGHSYFDLQQAGKQGIIDRAEFGKGARACLELVAAAFSQRTSPEWIDLGKLEQSEAFVRARNHVEYERSQYKLALQHGKWCQLSVPLEGSGRPMIVDALFLEERNPSGLLKMFARSDRENTWTQRGFDVLALYRPLEAGTGGDMTISLAPELGLTLKALWGELERLETERWGEDRPRDNPRKIASYRDTPNAPNQPWWDHYGTYSLLGAPKNVRIAGQEQRGSRLDWYKDVLPAVWNCYSPIPEDNIHFLSEKGVDIGSKKLLYGWWTESVEKQDDAGIVTASSIANCPTFRAWLKAKSSPGKIINSPLDLPSDSSYRVQQLDGGFLIIHRDGVTAFEDWTGMRLEIDAISKIFKAMANAWSALMVFHDNQSLEQVLEYQERLLASPSFRRKEFEEWKKDSWVAQAKVLKVGVSVVNHADPWPLNEFRASLVKMWGFDEQRHETLETIDHIDRVTSEIASELRERSVKFLHTIGAALATGFVFKEAVEAFQPAVFNWQWKLIDWFFPNPAKPPTIETLHDIRDNLERWDWAAVVFMLVGFVVGGATYWISRTKLTED